nr:phenylacetic acid degradation bifunctional protein PaaZ [Spelaeicoccus albus]
MPSYVTGRWVTPAADGKAVADASTGRELCRVSSDGIDLAEVFDYARTVGGPAVRALTFHRRALKLKELAGYLNDRVAKYHDLSYATGTTKRDAVVDIDGGISTTFVYGSKGRREMPNDTVYLDGPTEPLGRAGTFAGQHIYTSLTGVAVQINAFNFPVWGMLEKLAPTFLSGLPTVVKPATSTAHLTRAVVADIIESGILPEGALQLVCGSLPDFLDHLGEQDVVAFTGSAATATALRSHRNVVAGGVRFTAEADSLNFSILGPDAVAGTEEFDLFVRGLVTELSVKAGQKCTAIRRALVPAALMDDVASAVRERIESKVVVGDPRADGVTMGPVVSIAQRDEVLRSLKSLAVHATFVVGDATASVDPVGADAESGAFVPPTVLRFDDPWSDAAHDVEAFGPVTSLLPYDDTDQAVRLAARGKGSLVGSVVSHDPAFVRAVVLGTAPWHGRVLVLDRDDAKESTGHGSPLPHLVHGGPGRAGGGEELGGIRGVLAHMQRTAVQASPAMLTAITGRWTTGAERNEAEHPFSKSLAELRIGDAVTAGPRVITADDVAHFAEFTGDTFYAHTNPEAAAANPFFPGIVAHGYLVVSIAAGLFVWPEPGPVLANYGLENLRFITPVSPGDSVTVTLTAKQITPRETDDYGEVRWDADVRNQDGDQVAAYDVLTLVEKTKHR